MPLHHCPPLPGVQYTDTVYTQIQIQTQFQLVQYIYTVHKYKHTFNWFIIESDCFPSLKPESYWVHMCLHQIIMCKSHAITCSAFAHNTCTLSPKMHVRTYTCEDGPERTTCFR